MGAREKALAKIMATPDSELTPGQRRIKNNAISEKARKAAAPKPKVQKAEKQPFQPAPEKKPKPSSGSIKGAKAKRDFLKSL